MTTVRCKVDNVRLVRDDTRYNFCDARNNDGDQKGIPNTCSVCTGYELLDVK